MMSNIIIFGMGYVGTVSAACLAKLGHAVIGVDPNITKVDVLNSGKSAILEPKINELLNACVPEGRLRAVTDGRAHVPWADVSFICVGTPSTADGGQNLEFIGKVAEEIGLGLREHAGYHVVVMRSTVFPSVTRQALVTRLEAASGKKMGVDFGVACQPEFLREGSAVDDFFNPPFTVIGQSDAKSGDAVAALYGAIPSPVLRTRIEEAELLKVVCNTFHALKVGFANEIGRLCQRLDINGQNLMSLFCQDDKLNISRAYLSPGFAFGGSCLPKDVRAINFNAMRLGADLPIVKSILASNQLQIEEARQRIHALKPRSVGIMGLSFKPHTDDLRESPMIPLIQKLWADDMDVLVYDPDVKLNRMLGSNKEYLERQLPQIQRILTPSFERLRDQCDVLVVCQKRQDFIDDLKSLQGRTINILDVANMKQALDYSERTWPRYQGLSW